MADVMKTQFFGKRILNGHIYAKYSTKKQYKTNSELI